MATYSRKLKDASGNYICPVTRAEMVYFSDDTKFDKLTFYPIGSVFQSFEETSPASLFGGTWEKIEGRFLFGSSSSYPVSSTGGEEKHTLTVSEMPSHTHGPGIGTDIMNYTGSGGGNVGTANDIVISAFDMQGTPTTSSTGGSQSHNNMPPYTVCNIWKRTA